MDFLKYFILTILLCLLIFWLQVRPFREKKTNEPERTAPARLLSRRVETGTHRSGRSSGMGYSYVLVFQTAAGSTLELFAHDTEYGAIPEGAEGTLCWKGPYFVSFAENDL